MLTQAFIKCVQSFICEPVSLERCQSSATCLAPVYRHCLAGDHIYITLHCLHLSPNLIITVAVLDIYSAATWKTLMSSLLNTKALCACEIEPQRDFQCSPYVVLNMFCFLFYSKLCHCFRCVCQKLLWGSILVKSAGDCTEAFEMQPVLAPAFSRNW